MIELENKKSSNMCYYIILVTTYYLYYIYLFLFTIYLIFCVTSYLEPASRCLNILKMKITTLQFFNFCFLRYESKTR